MNAAALRSIETGPSQIPTTLMEEWSHGACVTIPTGLVKFTTSGRRDLLDEARVPNHRRDGPECHGKPTGAGGLLSEHTELQGQLFVDDACTLLPRTDRREDELGIGEGGLRIWFAAQPKVDALLRAEVPPQRPSAPAAPGLYRAGRLHRARGCPVVRNPATRTVSARPSRAA